MAKNKLTDYLTVIKEKMSGSGDRKQTRAFVRIVQFFMVMIVLTIIARGTQGATLAVVDTATAQSAELSEEMSFDGGIVARNAGIIEAPPELLVREIFVGEGQKVTAGDSIARFDTEDIEDKLIRQQAKLDELILEKNILGQGSNVDDSTKVSAEIGIIRTVEDYEAQVKEDEILIKRAEQDLEDARDDLADAIKRAEKAAKEKEKNEMIGDGFSFEGGEEGWQQIDSITGLPVVEEEEDDDVPDADPTEAEKQAVKQAEQNLEDAKRTAEKNKLTYIRNIEDAERSLTSAEKAIYDEWREANNTYMKNSITARVTQADIVKQEKIVDTLAGIIENEGMIYALSDGIILDVTAELGTQIAESGEVAKITTEGGGFAAEITLDKKQAKKVAVNMPVIIKGEQEDYEAVITSMSSGDDTGNVTAVVNLPMREWKISDSVKVNIQVSVKQYNLCLPVESVFSDSNGSYVLTVEEENTVLGMQNKLVKIPVDVLMTNKTAVAVEGALTKDMQVVSGSNKPVSEGNNVRVSQK